MAGERKVIRDAVKSIVEQATDLMCFSSRRVDARVEQEFINVYFESGEIQYDGVKEFTTAQIVVCYNNLELIDDDEIDEMADMIHEALASQEIAPSVVQGFVPSGWDYIDDRERAFSGINLRYSVTY